MNFEPGGLSPQSLPDGLLLGLGLESGLLEEGLLEEGLLEAGLDAGPAVELLLLLLLLLLL